MSKAWSAALEILKVEEQARQQPKLKSELKLKPKTEIFQWRDKLVKDKKVLADVEGSGKLVKCRIVSPSSGFRVQLKLDGEIFIDDTYADLEEAMAAYEEDDVYYVHVVDKVFREGLQLVVSVTEEITFTLLHVEVLLD
jgi:hypothetical protein